MALAAPENADPISPDWPQAPSNSRNLCEGIHLPYDDDYAGLAPVVEWLKAHSDSRNEDDELANDDEFTNEVPPDAGTEDTRTVPAAAAGSATSPRRQRSHNNNLNPNGRATCMSEGCGQTFSCAGSLRRHESKHNPDGLHCQQCDYSTYRKDSLQRHQNRMHSSNPDSFHCQQCNYSTHRKDALRGHQNRMHNPNPDSFHCQQCGYRTSQKVGFRRHLRKYHGGIHVSMEREQQIQDNEDVTGLWRKGMY